MFTSEKMVKFLQEKSPPGTRIRLVSMDDPYAPVAPGTEGTLVCVDDAGQFQMKWDNGRTLALIPGEDSFTVLPPERSMLKLYMPLTAELYEPDEWGDMPEEAERLTGGELASYEDKIRSALFKNRMQEEQIRGMDRRVALVQKTGQRQRQGTFRCLRCRAAARQAVGRGGVSDQRRTVGCGTGCAEEVHLRPSLGWLGRRLRAAGDRTGWRPGAVCAPVAG